MPRLPDRFDLWVRRARDCPDPARQVDYVLGALASLPSWHFLNVGTREQPQPATAEIEGARHLLVFSDPDRVLEIADQLQIESRPGAPPIISVPTASAMAACVADGPMKCAALLVNPHEDAVAIPVAQVELFARERKERGATGFWIPSMTSEEEDFWQEHGL
jgi:hypothetical protein